METLIVAIIVAGAVVYVGRRAWVTMSASRAARAAHGCAAKGGEDCGCG